MPTLFFPRALGAAGSSSSSSSGVVWRNRDGAAQAAYNNTRLDAPEHISMVEALPDSNITPHDNTNLNTLDGEGKEQLREHLEAIKQILTCVCFQCSTLSNPKPGNTIAVKNITKRVHCRAYRVFEYYIDKLENDTGRTAFLLCEQMTEDSAKFFTCGFC